MQSKVNHGAGVSVGPLLRDWRLTRRLSQLALAAEAGISARHLSFVETGRARPSREMIVLLADVLDVPLRERNLLLLAGGFAPLYCETSLLALEMAPVRQALEFFLKKHDPYPVIVTDRDWNVLMSNRASRRVFGLFLDPAMVQSDRPLNSVVVCFDPHALRPFIANWDVYAAALIQRIHRHALGGVTDEATKKLLCELFAFPGVPSRWQTPDLTAAIQPLLRLELRKGDLALSFFAVFSSLSMPSDITLQELRIECMFPGDQATEALCHGLVADLREESDVYYRSAPSAVQMNEVSTARHSRS